MKDGAEFTEIHMFYAERRNISMGIFANDDDRQVFQQEFRERLPARILDAHVHVRIPGDFPENFRFPEGSCFGRFRELFTIDLWRRIMDELLPGKECFLNCFGIPDTAVLRDAVPAVDNRTSFGMALVSPGDPVEILQQRIEKGHLAGVKPYLDFAAAFYSKPCSEVEIRDMLTEPQLEYLNAAGLAVTFHIPRAGRFADPLNQKQMVELCKKYPRITFLFAHIGRAYFMKNIEAANLEELAEYPNAWFDTAMLNNPAIFENVLRRFPMARIVFGSDVPIALLRGKSVEINNQYAYLMGEPYRIGNSLYDPVSKIRFSTFFYEQLRGLLAVLTKEEAEKVFYSNGMKLFQSISTRYQA